MPATPEDPARAPEVESTGQDEFAVGRAERLDDATSRAAAGARMRDQGSYVEAVLADAARRGGFDNLPGAGKPIEGLDGEHDPEWWLKKLVEREELVVLPPSVQLRRDDAALDTLLDAAVREQDARAIVEEFNARVLAARYGAPSVIPLVTQTRDVEETVQAWQQRRTERTRRAPQASTPETAPDTARRRWWRRS